MKKYIVLSLAITVCVSCKTFSLLTGQEIKLKTGVSKFEKKQALLVDVELDEFHNVPMLFDTGSSLSFVFTDSLFNNTNNRTVAKFGKTKAADGKKKKNKLTEFNIKTPWFESPNKVMALLVPPPPKCPAKQLYYGIIGIDAFNRSTAILELNFDDLEIRSYYDNSKVDSLIFKDYMKIKSTFDRNSFYIYPVIFGKEQKMMFDTGNLSSNYMPFSAMPPTYKDVRIIDGLSIKTALNLAGSETFILDSVSMKMGDKEIKTSISVIKDIEISNVGMPFIQRFNWLLDFRTNEIWISKNLTKGFEDDKIELKSQIAMISGEQIQIIAKLREAKYNVGDIIKSVDGEFVTAENNCRILKKLNDISWDKLEIEIQ